MIEKIDPDDYIEILKAFERKVWEDELTEKQQEFVGNDYSKIWKVKEIGRNGYNFFKRFFEDDYPGTARNHFVRKPDDYEGNPEIPIKSKFLSQILLMIGFKYPDDTSPKKLNTESKRANVLYEQFKSRNVENANKNDYSKHVDVSHSDVTNKPSDVTKTQYLQIANDVGFVSAGIDAHERTIFNIANSFFNCLKEGSYSEAKKLFAFNTSSEEVSMALLPNYHRENIVNIQYFDIDINKSFGQLEASCKVYCEEHVVVFTSEELQNITRRSIYEVEHFANLVEELAKKLKNLGFDDFDKLSIADLFGTNIYDYYFSLDKNHIGTVRSAFWLTKNAVINRIYQLNFEYQKDGWFISGVNRLQTNSLDGF